MIPEILMYDKSETNPSELLLGAMSDVASVSWYETGSFVHDFEQSFAQMIGVDHCVSCASGTDALILALKALECKQGELIALVANAGFYGSTAVHTLRASPVYVDVDDASLCMCPAALEDALKHHSIKAVIVTHLYGQLADITAIQALCRTYGVALIEDCAQATGAIADNGFMAGASETSAALVSTQRKTWVHTGMAERFAVTPRISPQRYGRSSNMAGVPSTRLMFLLG